MLAANDQCSTTRKALQIAVEMLLCKNVQYTKNITFFTNPAVDTADAYAGLFTI